jgi:hypothetical protein
LPNLVTLLVGPAGGRRTTGKVDELKTTKSGKKSFGSFSFFLFFDGIDRRHLLAVSAPIFLGCM